MLYIFLRNKMAFMDVNSLQKLSELLKPQEDDEIDEQRDDKSIYMTPGSIGQNQSNNTQKDTSRNNEKISSGGKTENKDIWEADDVAEGAFDDESETDERSCPEYEILFKQKVTTDDVFLGMTAKNQSTACCETLLIKIQLPGTERPEIELDVQDTFISCRTPKYRLALHLPNKVDSKNGKADWDRSKRTVEVSLPLNRDYDFMNF